MTQIIQQFMKLVLLETLTERETRIAWSRQKDIFGFDVQQLSFKEIALRENVSSQRIRQIVGKIERKIAHKISIIEERMKAPQVIIKGVELDPDANMPIVYKPIHALGIMTVRTANCLHEAGIQTMQQLIEQTESSLMRLPNLGTKSLNEIKKLLADNSLKLSEIRP